MAFQVVGKCSRCSLHVFADEAQIVIEGELICSLCIEEMDDEE